MANERFTGTEGEPLAAPIADRLRAKLELEREAEGEKAAAEHSHDHVERRKAEERQAVADHLAPFGADTPEGWHAQREAARSAPQRGDARPQGRGAGRWFLPIAAALTVLALPRALRWLVGLPVVVRLLLRDVPERVRD